MATQFPSRFIGFNAFGLAFDHKLGATASDPRNFFQYLRGEKYPFNVVKVVCFSNATIEVEPVRAIQLYNPDKSINPAYLDNLSTLVDRANDEGFKVQVCLFHYHAVADAGAAPDNNPFAIDYTGGSIGLRNRLRKFFTPTANDNNKKLQKQLVTAVGEKLKNKTNVLWELCNEVRMDGGLDSTNTPPTQVQDNWNLVGWLQQIEAALKQVVGNDIQVCTSSGTEEQNEEITCKNVPSTYFDFHFDQWNEDGRYTHFIQYARDRAARYAPGHPLVCNDDGAKEIGQHGATPENTRTEGNVKNWAGTAFQFGLSYMLKSTYPSKLPWNIPALRAIKFANDTYPLPHAAQAAEAKTTG